MRDFDNTVSATRVLVFPSDQDEAKLGVLDAVVEWYAYDIPLVGDEIQISNPDGGYDYHTITKRRWHHFKSARDGSSHTTCRLFFDQYDM